MTSGRRRVPVDPTLLRAMAEDLADRYHRAMEAMPDEEHRYDDWLASQRLVESEVRRIRRDVTDKYRPMLWRRRGLP